MDFKAFKASLADQKPPQGLAPALRALWWDAKGDWERAHTDAQADDGATGAWVHAYLHRKEGDSGNARYWYRRAAQPVATSGLAAEWETIARSLLDLS
jgi:hypothetical protein